MFFAPPVHKRSCFPAVIVIIASILGVLGCAGRSPRPTELPSEAMLYLRPAVDTYADPKTGPRIAGLVAESEPLARRFHASVGKEYYTRFERDPRVEAAAHALAHAQAAHGTPPKHSFIRWALWKLGVAGSIADTGVSWAVGSTALESLDKELRSTALEFDEDGAHFLFGVARVRTGAMRWDQVILVVKRAVNLDPFPKSYAPGQMISLSGTLPSRDTLPSFRMTVGTNETLTLPLETDEKGRFSLLVPAPSDMGSYRLQVNTSTSPHNIDTLLELPFYVGQLEPDEPEPFRIAPKPNPWLRSRWPAVLTKKYNRARVRLGLPPLKLHDDASDLAEEHAAELARHPYVDTPPFARELAAEGSDPEYYSVRRYRFENLEQFAQSSLASPWRRLPILSDRYTHIGLGFAPIEDDREAFYVVQLLFRPRAEMVAPFDIEEAPPPQVYGSTPVPLDDAANDEGRNTETPGFETASSLAARLGRKANVEVTHDPRLDKIAELAGANKGLPPLIRYALLWQAGCIGDIFHIYRRTAASDTLDPYLALKFASKVQRRSSAGGGSYALGLARVPTSSGWQVQSVVIVKRQIELEPFTPHFDPGEDIILRGRFLAKPRHPRFLISRGRDRVHIVDISPIRGDLFMVRAPAPLEPGRHMIQITTTPMEYDEQAGDIVQWKSTALLLPIWVGQDASEVIPQAWIKDSQVHAQPDRLPEHIISIYNAEREAYGKPPIALNEIASAVVEDKLFRDAYTFDSPSLLTLGRSLRETGVGVTITGRKLPVDEILSSARFNLLVPSSRSVILDEATTLAGVAVDARETWMIEMLMSRTLPRDLPPDSRLYFAARQIDESWKGYSDSPVEKVPLSEAEEKLQAPALSCYRAVLRHHPAVRGGLDVNYAVSSNGTVIAAVIERSTVRHPGLERCVAAAVRNQRHRTSFGGRIATETLHFRFRVEKIRGPEDEIIYRPEVTLSH